MGRLERVALWAGVSLAVGMGLSAQWAGSPAVATQAGAAAPVRIATLDAYVIVEKMMGADAPKKLRDDMVGEWRKRMGLLEKDMTDLDTRLSLLPQTDPKFAEAMENFRGKQREYQTLQAQMQQEVEGLSAKQLVEFYQKVTSTGRQMAEKAGYTHLIANREYDKPITTSTVGATLQELLARPIIRGPQGDDLTRQVAAELKVDISEQAGSSGSK